MWDIDSFKDFITFLLSFALGALFSIVYDIFIATHKTVFKSTLSVFITDISYFGIISLLTFLFCVIRANGYIRGYIIFGIILGFIVLHFTLSKFLSNIFAFLINLFKRVFYKLSSVLRRFFEWLLCKLKKIIFLFKKWLQMLLALLYNHFKSKRIG